MKDKVISTKDNLRMYVLDELEYKNKKYIMCIGVDENDEIIGANPHIYEVSVENNNLVTSDITDFEIASVVNNMFLARTQNN